MEELGIFCMDRRFNEYIEKNYGSMFIMRNAGANVVPIIAEIKQAVREKGIKKINVFAHTDCTAMGKVMGVLKENGRAEEELEDSLIKQFRELDFSSREELEQKNLELQLGILKKEFPELEVRGELLDTKKVDTGKHELEHVLAIFSPGKPDYGAAFKSEGLDPSQCYVVQEQIEVAMPDIRLAVNDLKARRVIVVTGNGDNPRDSKRYADLLGLKLSDLGAEVKRVDIRRVEKNRS
ncbi:MAG: hypothetical protein M1544_01655 [Candidatus Marsarchaeota archaeon]|nr:hypothetical protein [Candidatus Marsarchaeota archaeon]